MPRPRPAPPTRLPVYALYGELHGTFLQDERLHCESIAERSRLHDWEIRAHRHEAFFQILYIRRGRVRALLDQQSLQLQGPCVLGLPARAVHGFQFSPRIDGWVVTVLQAHLWTLLAHEPGLRDGLLRPRLVRLDPSHAAAVDEAVAALRAEIVVGQRWRTLALDAAMQRLAVAIDRADAQAGGPASPSGTSRAQLHAERYRALVEHRFREAPSVAALAGELGITPTQLNRVCRQMHGQGALAVLHGRVLLEAQRDLTYTTLSIKQIALGLGFADAGYFTRFFIRLAGCTPSQWRGRRTGPPGPNARRARVPTHEA